MLVLENKKKLLKIIKYAPMFLLSITIFILVISFFENKKKFEKDKEKNCFEYTQENQEIIKQRIYEVYNYIKIEQEHREQELKKTLKEAFKSACNINNQNKNNNEIKKVIENLNNWSWMISLRFYEDDMQKAINNKQKELNQEAKEYFFKICIFSFILVLLLVMVSILLLLFIILSIISFKNPIK